jgi:hypothetical protein
MTPDEQFFQNLIAKTEDAFSKSPIHLNNPDKKWFYSICATPLNKKAGLILGINWGVDGDHEAQQSIPDGKDIQTYGFIKRSSGKLKEHLKLDIDQLNFNYANLCFFRSPKEKDLSFSDYLNSWPLFEEYVNYINPPWILSLSVMNVDRLQTLKAIKNIVKYPDPGGRNFGFKAEVLGKEFYAVPHPNARLSILSRDQIWSSLFSKA